MDMFMLLIPCTILFVSYLIYLKVFCNVKNRKATEDEIYATAYKTGYQDAYRDAENDFRI